MPTPVARRMRFPWDEATQQAAEPDTERPIQIHDLGELNRLMAEPPVVYRGWTVFWTGWKTDAQLLNELVAQWWADKRGLPYRLAGGCPGHCGRIFPGQRMNTDWCGEMLIATLTSPLTYLQIIKGAAREKFLEFIDMQEACGTDETVYPVIEDSDIPF